MYSFSNLFKEVTDFEIAILKNVTIREIAILRPRFSYSSFEKATATLRPIEAPIRQKLRIQESTVLIILLLFGKPMFYHLISSGP